MAAIAPPLPPGVQAPRRRRADPIRRSPNLLGAVEDWLAHAPCRRPRGRRPASLCRLKHTLGRLHGWSRARPIADPFSGIGPSWTDQSSWPVLASERDLLALLVAAAMVNSRPSTTENWSSRSPAWR